MFSVVSRVTLGFRSRKGKEWIVTLLSSLRHIYKLDIAICDIQFPRSKWDSASPPAFTEHGAVMLAAVLNSRVVVAASIRIVRAFNRLRQLVSAHKDLAALLAALDRKVSGHDKHIQALFDAINQIMEPPVGPRKEIGFSLKPGEHK